MCIVKACKRQPRATNTKPEKTMNAAQIFLNALESQDSNIVYNALEDAAKSGDVQENQDWENGKSTWTFDDGSSIVMEGTDVAVESAE